jgi:hypothetical protein
MSNLESDTRPSPLGVDQFRALSSVPRRTLFGRFGSVDEIPILLCLAPAKWGNSGGNYEPKRESFAILISNLRRALNSTPDHQYHPRPTAPRYPPLHCGALKALEEEARSQAKKKGLIPLTVAPRYKYFSALEFLLPADRRAKTYDFADMYAEMLAKAPVNTPINFAGHSFGTYMMGRCTKEYEAFAFNRVYLAGSVLDERYFSISATPVATRLSEVMAAESHSSEMTLQTVTGRSGHSAQA